jgi:ribosomal protein S18 acetylase RimI-like enzyme
MSDEYVIRLYERRDLDAVYRVCLETGDSGEDATDLHGDPKLLGHIYTGPYVTYEPGLAFVLEDAEGVCGYTLGALDSEPFYRRMNDEWLPNLRDEYVDPVGEFSDWSPDEVLTHVIFHPPVPVFFPEYPAHLHIDILARAQGKGLGRGLMDTLIQALRDAGAPAVHLGMSVHNDRAYGFYINYGFVELRRDDDTIHMGLKL